MIEKPLISIVTVSYNAASSIEYTINSILSQTYENIEYIIIDGGSTDNTIDIIHKYTDRISYWISEQDRGIYDAMNKGIKLATGQWINFMNCGDSFYSKDIVENFTQTLQNYSFDIFYGDVRLIYDWGIINRKPLEIHKMKKQMPFCHQSCFVDIHLMKKHLFDLNYKICSDYNFFLYCYLNKKVFHYEPIIVSLYNSTCGLSFDNMLESHKEMAHISKQDKTLFWRIKYIYIRSSLYVKQYIPITILNLYHKLYLNKKSRKQ